MPPPRRKTVSRKPDAPIHPHRVWSGVGRGVERAVPIPIRFNNDTLRIAVREWQRDRAGALDRYGPIADWDTSHVTEMNALFANARTFNEPLTGWDTSSVESMSGLFQGAISFNQQLSQWDTRNVRNMGYLFENAVAFNQPLHGWHSSEQKLRDFRSPYLTKSILIREYLNLGKLSQFIFPNQNDSK